MKYNPIFYIYLILLIMGCSNEENADFQLTDYKSTTVLASITKTLKGSNIGPVDKYGQISDIHFYNNELLMLDIKADTILIKYNLQNKTLEKSLLKGEAPNQIQNADFIKITGFNNFLDDIQIVYFNKGLFTYNFNKQELINIFNPEEYNIQSIVKIQDSIFAMTNLDNNTEFTLYNSTTNKTKNIRLKQKYSNMIIPTNSSIAITPTDIGYNTKNKILFTWNGKFSSIELYQSNGGFIKSYSFGVNKNIIDKKFEPKHFYYYNLKTEDDFIYGIYSGYNLTENFVENLVTFLKSEIHIINIKTNEVVRYKLDKLVNTCTIDFNNKIIYCIEENNEAQPLVRYEMD